MFLGRWALGVGRPGEALASEATKPFFFCFPVGCKDLYSRICRGPCSRFIGLMYLCLIYNII